MDGLHRNPDTVVAFIRECERADIVAEERREVLVEGESPVSVWHFSYRGHEVDTVIGFGAAMAWLRGWLAHMNEI